MRKWYKKHPEKLKEKNKKGWIKHLRRLEEIAGRPRPKLCEICKKKRTIHFDHDHKTGKFRGWICYQCNSILGYANDDLKILNAITKYLKKSKMDVRG